MVMTEAKPLELQSVWEEPVPQPPPPTRRLRLARMFDDGSTEPVTFSDIAKALGISLSDVMALLKHGSINAAWLATQDEAKRWAYGAQIAGQGLGTINQGQLYK